VRVIAGCAGGLQLKAVPGRATRPTTDRVKESIFGILDPLIEGRRVIDLFAGTGGLGIEALSRGAAQAVLVDKSHQAAEVIRGNLVTTRLAPLATVLRMDCLKALDGLEREEGETFDLIFLDPPYGTGLAQQALERLARWRRLGADPVAVCEHANHDQLAEAYGSLALRRRERYGETIVSFYALDKG
jgi:16S rRNA (guanine(966)-N(2))-methyltransferase RsmD